MNKELKKSIEEENRIYWDEMSKTLSIFFSNIPIELSEKFWQIAFDRDNDNFNLIEIVEYIRAVKETDSQCSVEDIIDIFDVQGAHQ